MDLKIRELRRKFYSSKDDDEALDILIEIDSLQRQRFSELGEFLPASNKKVYVFDLDYQRWFELPERGSISCDA